MAIVILIFVIYALAGDRKNLFTARQFNRLKKIILGMFILSCFGSAIVPSLTYFIAITVAIGVILGPPIILFMILKSLLTRKKDRGVRQQDDSSGRLYTTTTQINDEKSIPLPKQASKRRKIVEKFNNKYELLLTESQIQRIVDASYFSPEWKKEISDMSKEYSSVYEWFSGDTAWLRAYLKVFKIQNLSSDFEQQKQICFNELDQVFRDTDLSSSYADEDSIREINDRFFTEFDDISFMIAYRFLEANGRKYDIGKNASVVKNSDPAEDLMNKYDTMTR